MKTFFRMIGLLLVIGLVLALVVPLLVPLPALPNLTSVENLKEADSQFIRLNNLNVHYKQTGSGQTGILLLHGFGASTFSWREVLQPLGSLGTVVAYDRPAFGLTDRPMPGDWSGASPYSLDAQAELVIAMLDAKGMSQAVLVGNSAGGTVAIYTALKYPQRVKALVLVDAAIYSGGGFPAWLKPVLDSTQGRWFGTLIARGIQNSGMDLLRTAWHDPSKLTDAVIAGYRKPLQLANFDRALWQLSVAQQAPALAERLTELKMPVLVITGDDDRIVPTEQSLRLAREIPGARLSLIQFCGHVPQEECPAIFLNAVTNFIQGLK